LNTAKWSSFLEKPTDYDPSAPLKRTCSREIEFPDSWVNDLISDDVIEQSPRLEPYKELEDRRIEISNFDPETTTEQMVMAEAVRYGDVQGIDLSGFEIGRIIVKFSDLRDAYAMRGSTIRINGMTWQLQFAHPEKIGNQKNPPNNGTLVLFHVPGNVTEEKLRSVFGEYGDLREIRTTQHQRFVEYWDLRAAERAFKAMKRGDLGSLKIAVEFSRPGGYRKDPDLFLFLRKPAVGRVRGKKFQSARENADQG
jgi:hypothetical protein